MNDRTERGAARAAMATELGEWGSAGAGASTPVAPRPEHFRYDRKEPGSMLPDPRSMPPSQHARIRATREAVIRGDAR